MFAAISKWLDPWYNKYAVMALAAVIALGAYEWISWACLTASDWGTWVGAIGTAATLAGTIWLATAEQRRQRRQELDRAFVAIAAIESQLEKMQETLDRAAEYFTDTFFEGYGFEYGIQANLLEHADIWTDEQILPLIVLPGHVCARLAAVRPIILDCVKTMHRLEETQGYSWVQESKAKEDGKLLAALLRSRHTVERCLKECRDFAAKAGFI